MNKKEKMEIVTDFLEKKYSDRINVELASPSYNDAFKALIACVISQRVREEVTLKVSNDLFSVADTAEKLSKLSVERIEKLIKPAGFYKQKAIRLKKISEIIVEKFNGKVPNTREELTTLPGVGNKTADVTLMHGHGIPSIAIDTHADRIPKRIGIVNEKDDLETVKETLESLVSKKDWGVVNPGLVLFGRDICKPVGPKCFECPLNKICEYGKNRVKELTSKK